jgi:thymidylate synthase
LGVPFNIGSSALLLSIVANITGLTARNLFMTLGDCHIYKEHYEAVELQLKRINYSFPEVKITKKVTLENLSSVKVDDFVLENYICHPGIKADMVA